MNEIILKMYMNLIDKGMKTIEDVPEKYRKEVEKAIKEDTK